MRRLGAGTAVIAASMSIAVSATARTAAVQAGRATAPAAPIITRAGGAFPRSAFLQWKAQATGGSPITGYTVTTFLHDAAVATTQVASSFTVVDAVVSDLVNGNVYRFKVAAKNAVGTGPQSELSHRVIPPFPTIGEFVSWQYGDFTGVSATPSEQLIGVDQINHGAAPASIPQRLRRTPDARAHVDPVTRLYFAFFARLPDHGGFDYWIRRDRRGMSLLTIADRFAKSPEYVSRYGALDNRHYIDLVYQNVLGRGPDAAGSDYWTGQLDAHARTRSEVMTAFSESPEDVTRRGPSVDVVVTWIDMLHATPSQATFDSWVTKLTSGGKTVADLAAAILPSDAYASQLP
ncbi:MAG: hypothetical protein JWN46_2363 [Acidimicrobiales bacterium]|nr:hypothetical protein [Acidimicrobiales bacterium]